MPIVAALTHDKVTMQPLILDFETYFTSAYSLKKLSVSEYVRDPRFQVLGGSLLTPLSEPSPRFFWPEELEEQLQLVDWANTILVAHNAKFEAFILHTHYDIHPARIFCTLDAVNAIYQGAIRAGLDHVARELGLGSKSHNVNIFKDKTLLDLLSDADLAQQLRTYCNNDTSVTTSLYNRIAPLLPASEHDLLDLTCKLFSTPVLEIDVARAEASRNEELAERQATIELTGLPIEELSGNESFAQALRSEGVEPPKKVSPKTGLPHYAFAKTDAGMQALTEHDNPKVRALAAARLAIKSTIGATRADRMVTMGSTGDNKLAVWLNYYGAHTGRWSGGNKMNPQNLPRGGELRRSILAPDGYVIVVADSAQIEARVLAWLAGEDDVTEAFRQKRDVYSELATKIYGYPVTKDNKTERFVGKVARLGLGYGMGAKHFRTTLGSGQMGDRVDMSLDDCLKAVDTFRTTNPNIVTLWTTADQWLSWMTRAGATDRIPFRDGTLSIDPLVQGIWMPNEMPLLFPKLAYNQIAEEYQYWNGKFSAKLYGGKLIENIVQALARNIVAEQMLAINQRYRVVTCTHDEVVAIAPTDEAEEALAFCLTAMSTPPTWCPDLPLDAEGGYDRNYSK